MEAKMPTDLRASFQLHRINETISSEIGFPIDTFGFNEV